MNDTSPPVFLHVGGQTTGAEDLVVYMVANRAALRRSGLGLYCFDPMGTGPSGLNPMMPEPQADESDIVLAAKAIAARIGPDRKIGRDGFVLSATDLAGPASELILGRFHSNVRKRARAVRYALGQKVDRMVLAVQPYDVLFHSIWMAMAIDRPMDPFSEYANALAEFQGGWAELAQTLVEELRVRELVVVQAPIAPANMLSQLVQGLSLRQPTEPQPKPKVTASAVMMAQRCFAQGTRLQPGQRDRLLAFHARQPQITSDTGFSALALSELHGRYVADLHSMAKLSEVTFVGATESLVAAE